MKRLWLILLMATLWSCKAPERQPPDLVLPWQEVHPCLSFDGGKVAFEADRQTRQSAQPSAFGRRRAGFPELRDILVWDRHNQQLEIVSLSPDGQPAQGDSFEPRLDAEGRRLVFASEAGNLVEQDRNANTDVFLVDLEGGPVRLLPAPTQVPGQGSGYAPEISTDGRRVAFVSYGVSPRSRSSNRSLVVYDTETGQSRHLEQEGSVQSRPTFSPDGSRLAWGVAVRESEDAHSDFFRTVKSAPSVEGPVETLGVADQVSLTPVLTNQGCAFIARASGGTESIYGLFFRPYQGGSPEPLIVGNDDSLEPSLSHDGRFLVFSSYATDLVPGDDNGCCDVFCLDRSTGQTQLVSRGGDGHSFNPAISGDGRWVAFASVASNLVEGAAPGQVYLWDRVENELRVVPTAKTR